jgi:tRNA(fMet)-specific endonuclease VapC
VAFVLDTDHFSELDRATTAGDRLRKRINDADEAVFICIVTAEETLRGWLAKIHGCKNVAEQMPVYARLERSLRFLNNWVLLSWDEETVARYEQLRRSKVRIGTMDLKIASAALACDMTVLTRNTVDFAKVPGLRFENWLD